MSAVAYSYWPIIYAFFQDLKSYYREKFRIEEVRSLSDNHRFETTQCFFFLNYQNFFIYIYSANAKHTHAFLSIPIFCGAAVQAIEVNHDREKVGIAIR